MMHVKTREIYDSFGKSYYSPKHRTIRYFNAIQTFPIRIAFSEQAMFLKKSLEELDILNIGVGNGQHCEQLCLPTFDIVFGERARWDKITDYDISPAMLAAAKRYYPSKEWQTKTGEREPKQITGDALEISDYLPPESFDIVLAGLCDHIEDQEKMYAEVLKVLKPDGIFITTYPHKKLMTTIRRDLYGIDPSFTRFKINEQDCLVPSYIPEPKDIEKLLNITGFNVVEAESLQHDSNFDHHNGNISNTIRHAQEKIGKSLEEIPILVFAIGRKPNGLSTWERKEKEDPWFWYN
jgi:SAM-dependent methyltransferase